MRRTRNLKPIHYLVEYREPCKRKPRRYRVGYRQLEMLELLAERPATRLDMIKQNRIRAGLNATGLVRALRDKGFHIVSNRMAGTDAELRLIHFVRYQLKGELLSAYPIPKRRK